MRRCKFLSHRSWRKNICLYPKTTGIIPKEGFSELPFICTPEYATICDRFCSGKQECNQSTRQRMKTTASKKKTNQTRGIGSYAIRMTYGEYIKEYPKGNRDDSAKKETLGYAVISKRDKTNINWLSERAFSMINEAFSRVPKA